MSPLDQLLQADLTGWVVGVAFVALLVWIARQVRSYHRAPSQARPDRHIPVEERELLGDDWREPAADFFAESFIRSTRRRLAVYSVTGADPEKNEAAAVDGPASRTKENDSLAISK